jgi:hypothetical protein
MSFMEANTMTKAPHLPYWPDLEPSDFLLFGEMTRRLRGCSFDNADELLGAIHAILAVFEAETLNHVFCEWMMRRQRYIDIRGEDFG